MNTYPEGIELAERKVRVLELRKNGYNYEEIAKIIKVVGAEQCRRYVVEAIHDLEEQQHEWTTTIKDARLKELRQLAEIYRVVALAGQTKALDAYLKILQREAAFLGADAPTKMQVSATANPYEGMDLDALREEARRRNIPVVEVVDRGLKLLNYDSPQATEAAPQP